MEQGLNDSFRILAKGHVLITDVETGEVVLDKPNAINVENMSYAIARALAAQQLDGDGVSGSIHQMRFGNGGTVVITSEDRINYKTPRVTSLGGLYSERYIKNINSILDSSVDANFNSVKAVHIPGQVFSDLICTCTLGLNEPNTQSFIDMDPAVQTSYDNQIDNFVFDELALYDYSGEPLTHIIFHPIQKAANRVLQIKYTIRFQLV